MSKIEVNTVDVQCGSTLTLGSSGKTVTLATGASSSGFGMSWCTTVKTSPFSATAGNNYFINTTCGAVTVTLPASPSDGDEIGFKDYAATFDCNPVTLNRNTKKIQGLCCNGSLTGERNYSKIVYSGSTKGWLVSETADASELGPKFIAATGGTITTVCTDYKVHTFNSDGCFQVTTLGNAAGSNTVNYLVIAGGGGGGSSPGYAGGGGAGGYREVFPQPGSGGLAVTATTYPITIGGGGGGASTVSTPGAAGSNSVFSTITSAGGGAGKACHPAPPVVNGGSGGGGGGPGATPNPGGTGNTPPVSPAQGFAGGNGSGPPGTGGGGGGGASAVGKNFNDPTAACQSKGGAGVTSAINGTPTARGGGGSAAGDPTGCLSGNIQPGGLGGGGTGGKNPAPSTAGTANTGGGGGGGGNPGHTSMGGGSGVVIIRYKFQ
jgi:hypothetical protein